MQIIRSCQILNVAKGSALLALTCWFGLMAGAICCSSSYAVNNNNQLVVGVPDPIHTLDPAAYRLRTLQIIAKNMFDSLTTRDADMKVVPQLAESWRAIDDNTWEFKLRKGVTFHNNDPFSAADVKFSLERILKEGGMDGVTSPRRSLLGPVSEVRVVDRHTVLITTEKSWPILPLMLSLQEIVPQKYISDVGSEAFGSHPIGTGPFKFVRLDKQQRITMERFENYYGGSPAIPPVQKAPLESLVFHYSPLGSENIRMLKKGDSHIISRVNPLSIPILDADPNLDVIAAPATRSHFAEINCTKPPFDDLRIRRAFNHSVDFDNIISKLLHGSGIRLSTVLLPQAVGYNKTIKPYRYDPELSKQLLKDAGYDSNRVLQIYCTKDAAQLANNIAAFLSRVGVKSKISLAEPHKPVTMGKDAPWDLYLGFWGNSTLDPVGIIVPKFISNGRGNFSGYSNQTVDSLIAKAERTSDSDLRERLYKEIQEIIYKDAPMIFGYAKIDFYGVNKYVKNFIPSSTGMMNMHDVFIAKESDQ